MATLRFGRASVRRKNLVESQRKQLRRVYSQAAKNTQDKIRALELENKDSATSSLNRMRLRQLEKELEQVYNGVSERVEDITLTDMRTIVGAVDADIAKSLSTVSGMHFTAKYASVSSAVVDRVALGQLYEGNWTLSKAIWGDSKHITRDISQIIATGIAENKSAYDIAKDLEMYVDPKAAKPYDWGRLYPGSKKVIDYNAQRIARTLVSHAYQAEIVETARNSPFSGNIRWLSAHSQNTCSVCEERDGKVYSVDEVPLDHPNGMCDFEIVSEMSLMDISNRLAAWARGGSDPDLDRFLSGHGISLIQGK